MVLMSLLAEINIKLYKARRNIMDNLFTKKVPLYFETDESQLVVGDSFKIINKNGTQYQWI